MISNGPALAAVDGAPLPAGRALVQRLWGHLQKLVAEGDEADDDDDDDDDGGADEDDWDLGGWRLLLLLWGPGPAAAAWAWVGGWLGRWWLGGEGCDATNQLPTTPFLC